MTRHTMVTFQLHRKGVMLIAIGCLLLAVLLLAAGYIAGVPSTQTTTAVAHAVLKPMAPAVQPPQEAFALRVGIETSEDDAKETVKHLAMKKVPAKIVPAETREGNVIYEIQTGHYTDRRQAIAAAHDLKRNSDIQAAIVPAP